MYKRGFSVSEKLVYGLVIIILGLIIVVGYQYIARDSSEIGGSQVTVIKSSDSSAILVVPKDAGVDTSKISIERVKDFDSESGYRVSDTYILEPSGLAFNKPVELRITYLPNTVQECPEELDFYHYNDDGTLKEIIPAKSIYCGITMAVFEIDSFSEGHGEEEHKGGGICNKPSGTTPQISSVNPKTGSRSDTFTITGTDLTNVVQFYTSNSKNTYVGKVNNNCNQVTLPVPKDLPAGAYTLKIYRARDKISNGQSVTITGAATDDGDERGGNCNSPSGAVPKISSITPTQVKIGDTLTIKGQSLTKIVQFYSGSGRDTYTGKVNAGCSQTTIKVPNGLADGTYTVKIYRAKNKISNGQTITIASGSGGGGSGGGGGGSVLGGGNCPANNIPISLPYGTTWRSLDIAYSPKSNIALGIWSNNKPDANSKIPGVVGQFIKGDGTLQGNNIVAVSTGSYRSFGVKVAYDSDDDIFLVVGEFEIVDNKEMNIYGSLIKPDGTYVKQNFQVTSSNCHIGGADPGRSNRNIDYSSTAKKFYITCTKGAWGKVMLIPVSPDGTVGQEIEVAPKGGPSSVAAGSTNILVTWNDWTNRDVNGRLVNNDGTFAGSEFLIPKSGIYHVAFFNPKRNEYDVFYGWGKVDGRSIKPDGTIGAEKSYHKGSELMSDVAYDSTSDSYWVVTEDSQSENNWIYQIKSDGSTTTPLPIAENANVPNYVPAVTVLNTGTPLSLMNRAGRLFIQFGSLTNSGDCSGTSTYGITGTNVLRTWTPTQTTNGKNPQLSPDGKYVTYGFGQNWVADLQTQEERTFGTGHNGWWIANDKYTYIKELSSSESQRYEVKVDEWNANAINEDKSLVAGNQFVAADGHWASWLEGTGRIAYDNEVLGTDLGGPIWISENQIVHANGTNNDKILLYNNKQNTATYTSQVAANELTINKGYIVYGGLGPIRGITPNGQDVDLTVAPWNVEGFGQAFFVDNAPWVASATFDALKQKGYIMLRPWGQNDGILIDGNVSFGLHVVYFNNTFVVAYSDNSGKLNVVWVSKNATVVNLVNALNQGSGSSGIFSIVQEQNILSSSINLGSPNVAFDEQNKIYLVSYESSGELYGIFLDKDGSAIGQPFSIGSLAGTIFGVKVAWGGETFAVFYTVGTSGNDYVKANLVKYVPGQQPQISSDIVVDTLKGKRDKWRGTSVAYSPSTGYFLASWYNSNNANTYSNGHSYIRGIKLDETLTQTIQLTDRAPSFQNCLYATPHIAVDPSSGTAIVVGHRDPTNDDDCKNKPANWYRLIDTSTMIALGQTGYTASASAVPSQSVAFSGSINKFLIVWSKQVSGAGTILGQAVALDDQIDQYYTIKTADTSNSDRLDDNLGLYTVSYNKGADKFLIAMRGDDTPQTNGEAPVYIMEMNGDGSPISNTFMKLSNQMNNQPSTDIAANPLDKQFLVVYRPKFKKFDSVLINS